jgi:hypothetical protein
LKTETEFVALTADVTDFIRRVPLFPAASPPSEAEFNRLALQLFRFQFDSVPVYRRFCEGRGCRPSKVAHWEKIPLLPVSAFKESDVSSLPEAARVRVFHSSGTTGRKTSRNFHSGDSLIVYEASLQRWFESRLLPEGPGHAAQLHLLALTPPGSLSPHSSLVHMFETIGRSLLWASRLFAARLDKDGSWQLDLSSVRRILEASVREGCPVALVGTAFSFVHLLEELDKHGAAILLPPGSRALETGGYKGKSRELPKAELYAWMERRLGLAPRQIVSEYGMSELGSQAYDQIAGRETGNPALRRFHFPPWTRARVISPETGRDAAPGEPGLLAILDLANVASCLALQTEDMAMADTGGLTAANHQPPITNHSEDMAVAYHGGWTLLGRAPHALPRGCSLMPA